MELNVLADRYEYVPEVGNCWDAGSFTYLMHEPSRGKISYGWAYNLGAQSHQVVRQAPNEVAQVITHIRLCNEGSPVMNRRKSCSIICPHPRPAPP